MQLTGEEIKKRGYVTGPPTLVTRRASVDLTVGSVVIGGKEHHFDGNGREGASVRIEPQQMFVLVSRETVRVPPGHAANALPKTGLCNEGILCINTGIIDTGYDGLISTTAINFGREPYLISAGDAFLRVVVHPLEGLKAEEAPAPEDVPRKKAPVEYVRDAKRNSIRFPAEFMNVPGQIERLTQQVSNDLLARQTNDLLKWVGVLSLLFVLWNLGAYVLLQRQATVSAAPVSAAPVRVDAAPARQVDSLRAELRFVIAALDSLRRRVQILAPAASAPGTAGAAGTGQAGSGRADAARSGAVPGGTDPDGTNAGGTTGEATTQ